MEAPSEQPARKTRKKRAVSAARKADSKQAAAVMVATVDAACQGLFGPEAGFNPLEQELIEPPLARILAKADPEKMGQFAALMDPLLLVIGLALWGSRVQKLALPPKPKADPPPLSQLLRAVPSEDPSIPPKLTQNLRPAGEI